MPGSWTFVPLAGGEYTLIDSQDYPWMSRFRWRVRSGYASREKMQNWVRRHFRLHRELLGLSESDTREVDHINRDRLDNRRCNLRVVTHAQNGQNVPAQGGTSPHRGVSFCRQTGRWRAHVMIDGKQNQLGRFDTEQEAAIAAAAFRRKHMPFAED